MAFQREQNLIHHYEKNINSIFHFSRLLAEDSAEVGRFQAAIESQMCSRHMSQTLQEITRKALPWAALALSAKSHFFPTRSSLSGPARIAARQV